MTLVTRDMTDSARQTLTRQLMSRVDRPDLAKPFGLYFVAPHGDWGPLARFVEREVFQQRFDNDSDEMDREYGPYEDSSFFVLAVDHLRAEPIGEFRIVEDSPAGLKTLQDIEREPGWGTSLEDFLTCHRPSGDLAHVIDAATLAVRREWSASRSGALASLALYGGLFRAVLAVHAELLVTTIDETVADMLRLVEVPIEPLCGLPAIEYLGSPATRPYVIEWEMIEAARNSSAALMGIMMGGAVDHEFSLPPIDLTKAIPHPIELEPQFIIDPEPVDTTTRDSVEHSAPID